jgi:hypothetical protein
MSALKSEKAFGIGLGRYSVFQDPHREWVVEANEKWLGEPSAKRDLI